MEIAEAQGSTPTLSTFDPKIIPFQWDVIKDVRLRFYYKDGPHQLLFSGSVGSSKSLILAHLLVTHCLLYPKARALMGRLVLSDLKDTLLQKVIEHIGDDMLEGRDYEYNRSAHKFTFRNGSELISRSWHDKDFKKFRSLELSAAGVEEASENTEEYKQFYFELIQRVGRLPHVPESWLALATNPDSPHHWLYKHFMVEKKERRHVYYSRTSDNPFLPASYIENLKETLDAKQVRRMIYGEWIEIAEEVVYYNYLHDRNFKNTNYEFDPTKPIDLMHDFNIGEGKPMSAAVGQHIENIFHIAKGFAVEGARTSNIMDEIASTGLFDKFLHFRVFGDASGKSRDTRSIKSDYQIIIEYLSNYERKDGLKLRVEQHVPLANPPIRERHNLVNAAFEDANKKVKMYLYKGAEIADEGFRLTKFKKGGNYLEDDSFKAQHITTAIGYWVHYLLKKYRNPQQPYQR